LDFVTRYEGLEDFFDIVEDDGENVNVLYFTVLICWLVW